ncbi:hypothetical protein KBY55_26780 [Streptomyces sp. b94]|uniref:hypothetical protein n=1 Tax=Streptomyces sp. b94 TaxID=1827634 RepID=UPI001B39675D|nr:hypothetical protein [Streptomyces sp. b94]MBQ1099568.1 hypothetical protein [Streptomyces sp. b94]
MSHSPHRLAHPWSRLCAFLATAGLMAAALVFAPAASASSDGLLDLTCTVPSSEATTYNPPLTLTPQDVTFSSTVQYGPCVSLSHPEITSGSRSLQVLIPDRSCLTLLEAGVVTFTITWNTGQTSTISGSRTATVVGAALVVTVTGNVTSGVFAGDSVVQTSIGPATDILACTLGLGTVDSVYSTITLEITSL